MFDIEEWFENGTGLKIRELRYLKTPPLPFNIFMDDIEYKGADLKNNIIKHNCVIEHYSEKIDTPEEKQQEHKIEELIENKNWKYSKERE